MNSSVTLLSASSVISSFCLPMSCNSRSNGPVKLVNCTWKPVIGGCSAGTPGAVASGWVTPPTLPTGPADSTAPPRVAAAPRGATGRLPEAGRVLGDDLAGQLAVVARPGRRRVQRGDRRTGHGRLGELHRL